jgi:Na+-transporting NADH:ubiquinone oxidoreductase subunit A
MCAKGALKTQRMARHRISKGLDLPIQGAPEQRIESAPQCSKVAVIADDYIGMRPTMHVSEGEEVRRGQLLFEDKKTPGVRFTAPASGEVIAIHRGERRRLLSLVIRLDNAELAGSSETVPFQAYSGQPPEALRREQVKELLIESGLWTALRTRPYSKAPKPETSPDSVFVTAMDTNPLAPSADVAMEGREEDFGRGLRAMAKISDGPVYVCKAPGSKVSAPSDEKFRVEEFAGPHPAGTPGLHIHKLHPVNRSKLVWYINYQDVIAIGRLFATGELDVARVVSLAGPSVSRPRLLRTRVGASIDELVQGELAEGKARVISGSVLSGRIAAGDIFGYLGRYHHQVSVLPEGGDRPFMGWMGPGFNRFSVSNTFLSKLLPGVKYRFTTATNGSSRAMVPIGMYEKVFPMDILPSFLLRAIHTGNVERAEALGCLELDEEDLALCTFVDPGKTEWGPILREVLTIIEKEG